jgi:hypothetical protein
MIGRMYTPKSLQASKCMGAESKIVKKAGSYVDSNADNKARVVATTCRALANVLDHCTSSSWLRLNLQPSFLDSAGISDYHESVGA